MDQTDDNERIDLAAKEVVSRIYKIFGWKPSDDTDTKILFEVKIGIAMAEAQGRRVATELAAIRENEKFAQTYGEENDIRST